MRTVALYILERHQATRVQEVVSSTAGVGLVELDHSLAGRGANLGAPVAVFNLGDLVVDFAPALEVVAEGLRAAGIPVSEFSQRLSSANLIEFCDGVFAMFYVAGGVPMSSDEVSAIEAALRLVS